MTARGIGGSEADPVLKALIARLGIFANSREEAVYFQGYVDNPRRKLTGDGRYRIEGSVRLPAEWWSITLYNSRELLHPNPQRRYSFASFNLQTAEDGSFAIDAVPPGEYDLVAWHPHWKVAGQERDPENMGRIRYRFAPPLRQRQRVRLTAGEELEVRISLSDKDFGELSANTTAANSSDSCSD